MISAGKAWIIVAATATAAAELQQAPAWAAVEAAIVGIVVGAAAAEQQQATAGAAAEASLSSSSS